MGQYLNELYTQNFTFALQCEDKALRRIIEMKTSRSNADDTGHQWSLDLKEHIASTIHDRNMAEQDGKSVSTQNISLHSTHGWMRFCSMAGRNMKRTRKDWKSTAHRLSERF